VDYVKLVGDNNSWYLPWDQKKGTDLLWINQQSYHTANKQFIQYALLFAFTCLASFVPQINTCLSGAVDTGTIQIGQWCAWWCSCDFYRVIVSQLSRPHTLLHPVVFSGLPSNSQYLMPDSMPFFVCAVS